MFVCGLEKRRERERERKKEKDENERKDKIRKRKNDTSGEEKRGRKREGERGREPLPACIRRRCGSMRSRKGASMSMHISINFFDPSSESFCSLSVCATF